MRILGFNITRTVPSGGGQEYKAPPAWMTSYLGPNQPITPITPAKEVEVPRSIDYPISVNSQLTPRTGYGLMPYSQILLAYEKVPECRFPVNLIQRQLSTYTPRLVDRNGNTLRDHPFQWMCEYPDGRTPFSVWMTRYLKSAKIYDAPALYFERDRGVVSGLHFIDGSTLFVILDEYGNIPMPELVQDYVSGYSETQAVPQVPGSASGPKTIEAFIEQYNNRLRAKQPTPVKMPAYTQVIKGTPYAWWASDDIWYMPESRRVNSPYGEPFIESAWPWIMIIVNLTAFELAHYRTGNMPEGYITIPKDWLSTPDQLEALELAFNERMTRNPVTERNRLRIFPDGSKWFQTKRGEWPESLYNRARSNILDQIGVPPAEVGDIPGQGLGGKGFKEGAVRELNRNTINPNRLTITSPFNYTLKHEGAGDAIMVLDPPLGEIDPQKLQQNVYDGMAHGTYSLNDGRSLLNMSPIGDPKDPNNIANLHMIVAGSTIYVIEDMEIVQGQAVPSFPSVNGLPAGPESGAGDPEHTPEDVQTLAGLMKRVLNGEGLLGKSYSYSDGKVSKVEAEYTPKAKVANEQCRVCTHFKANKCEIVSGQISPKGWCKYFVGPELEKHCGVCEEDDAYLGAPISREVTMLFPKTDHANSVEIVAMSPKGLPPKPALWKPEGGELDGLRSWVGGPLYLREEAAYRLDRSLGFFLIPVTYVAEAHGEYGAAIYYAFETKPPLPPDQYSKDWIEKAGVLDFILGQKDRGYKHNYTTHPDEPDRMILFDNGLTFPSVSGESSSCFERLSGSISGSTRQALVKCLDDEYTWSKIEDLVGAESAMQAKDRTLYLLGNDLHKFNDHHDDKGRFGVGGGPAKDEKKHGRKVKPLNPRPPAAEAEPGEEANVEADKLGGRRHAVPQGAKPSELVHHIPAENTHLKDTPTIQMEKGDHMATAGYGTSKAAREYRSKQTDLETAQKADLQDLQSKFGDKYSEQTNELRD